MPTFGQTLRNSGMQAVILALLVASVAQVADNPDAKPPVTIDDVRIVQRAKAIIDSPAKWNRADNRVCPADATTFSIYCALEKATKEIGGSFEHRGAAMQEARFVIDDIAPNASEYEHRLMDYNNDPTTSFEHLQKFFTLLEARVQERLALENAFRELGEMCARDAGRMWGTSLCGPTLLVDPKTRGVTSNEPAPAPVLPQSIGIANTSVEWGGKLWTMVMLPLPQNDYDRRVLLVHESFHRIQKGLGLFIGQEGGNAHLDTVDGRVWLQLEWRALAAALQGDRGALDDALAFRAKRRSLFPKAAEEEHGLEFREGLAEYTGTAFAETSLPKRIPHLVEALREAEKKPSFVRSFAYASGPAWGAMLEMQGKRPTEDVEPALSRLEPAGEPVLRAQRYGYTELLAKEKARDDQKQATLREFRARFVDGPVLVLPLRKFSFEMDPNASIPFEPYGTVFPTLTLRDGWGSIIVKRGGAMISSDWTRLTVPFPANDDYVLTLKDR